MEVLIFGAVSLLAIGVVVVFTALPFYVLWHAGARLAVHYNAAALKWLLPFGAIAAVGIWVASSVIAFHRVCKTMPRVEVAVAARGTPTGFVVVEDFNSPVRRSFNWGAAISSGAFQFVDLAGGRRCIGKKQHEREPQFPLEVRCDRKVPSQISVHLLRPRAIDKWWSPPIYESRIEIRDTQTKTVLARATDVIFGGGLIGMYMRLMGGDQDFQRLSCGYASPGIGPWRPSLSSRLRFREYEQADLALLLAPFRSN